ncbi:hypothetical protein MPSEU_000554400 [Mayamaea pseudoterrestris]|nr:hypothetical protein MPSEU_000554400 [Mayamaea pseudoterrestris]
MATTKVPKPPKKPPARATRSTPISREKATRDYYERKWQANYNELLIFKEKSGHCNVPRIEGKLGAWVADQRILYRKLTLDTDREAKLNDIGFTWEIRVSWQVMFERLKALMEKNGHCNVPAGGGKLGPWVTKQRMSYKNSILDTDREAKLNSIGFLWQARARESWLDMFDRLKVYKEMHGHCNVPAGSGNLGTWVSTQRKGYQKSTIDNDREAQLNGIGFVWQVRVPWHGMFERLKVFKEMHGHCYVPYNEGTLGTWVKSQRRFRWKKPHRVAALNSIGFDWRDYTGKPTLVSEDEGCLSDGIRDGRSSCANSDGGKYPLCPQSFIKFKQSNKLEHKNDAAGGVMDTSCNAYEDERVDAAFDCDTGNSAHAPYPSETITDGACDARADFQAEGAIHFHIHDDYNSGKDVVFGSNNQDAFNLNGEGIANDDTTSSIHAQQGDNQGDMLHDGDAEAFDSDQEEAQVASRSSPETKQTDGGRAAKYDTPLNASDASVASANNNGDKLRNEGGGGSVLEKDPCDNKSDERLAPSAGGSNGALNVFDHEHENEQVWRDNDATDDSLALYGLNNHTFNVRRAVFNPATTIPPTRKRKRQFVAALEKESVNFQTNEILIARLPAALCKRGRRRIDSERLPAVLCKRGRRRIDSESSIKFRYTDPCFKSVIYNSVPVRMIDSAEFVDGQGAPINGWETLVVKSVHAQLLIILEVMAAGSKDGRQQFYGLLCSAMRNPQNVFIAFGVGMDNVSASKVIRHIAKVSLLDDTVTEIQVRFCQTNQSELEKRFIQLIAEAPVQRQQIYLLHPVNSGSAIPKADGKDKVTDEYIIFATTAARDVNISCAGPSSDVSTIGQGGISAAFSGGASEGALQMSRTLPFHSAYHRGAVGRPLFMRRSLRFNRAPAHDDTAAGYPSDVSTLGEAGFSATLNQQGVLTPRPSRTAQPFHSSFDRECFDLHMNPRRPRRSRSRKVAIGYDGDESSTSSNSSIAESESTMQFDSTLDSDSTTQSESQLRIKDPIDYHRRVQKARNDAINSKGKGLRKHYKHDSLVQDGDDSTYYCKTSVTSATS